MGTNIQYVNLANFSSESDVRLESVEGLKVVYSSVGHIKHKEKNFYC